MRTTLYMGMSLDGFIARPGDGLDFLPEPADGDDLGFAAFLGTVDVIVMGRRTFNVVRGFGVERWAYGRTPVVVLSRTLDRSRPPAGVPATVSVRAGEPAEVLRELAATGAQHVYVDGGATARSFLAAGLIDELVVTHVPVLIGAGISPWGPLAGDVKLRLIDSRLLPGGLVQSRYAVLTDRTAA